MEAEIILRCTCGCKCVVIYEEYENEEKELSMEFFENGLHNTTSFWSRLKYLVRYLFTGNGFSSGIIFHESQINELKKFLNKK